MPDGVMREQNAPYFLLDHLRRLGSQDSTVPELVDFDLIKSEFEFPPFVVECSQFACRRIAVIQYRGNETERFCVPASILDHVFDYSAGVARGGEDIVGALASSSSALTNGTLPCRFE